MWRAHAIVSFIPISLSDYPFQIFEIAYLSVFYNTNVSMELDQIRYPRSQSTIVFLK